MSDQRQKLLPAPYEPCDEFPLLGHWTSDAARFQDRHDLKEREAKKCVFRVRLVRQLLNPGDHSVHLSLESLRQRLQAERSSRL